MKRWEFQNVGANGLIEVEVEAGGGHVLGASLAVTRSGGSWLLRPVEVTPSRFLWEVPLDPAAQVPVLVDPARSDLLPWRGTPAIGYLRLGLAVAVLSGSGANANNLSATVRVRRDGVALQPNPIETTECPTGPMPQQDVMRMDRAELTLER
jgi:hypothetical protein